MRNLFDKLVVVGRISKTTGGRISGMYGQSRPGVTELCTVIASFANEAELKEHLWEEYQVLRVTREPLSPKYPKSFIWRPQEASRIEYIVVFNQAEFFAWSAGSFAEVKL
jgi:hypothetical protein